jgi:hypothetical protein
MPADLELLWRQARPRTAKEAAEYVATNIRRREQANRGEPVEPEWQPAPETLPILPGPLVVCEERTALDGRVLQRMSDGTVRDARGS